MRSQPNNARRRPVKNNPGIYVSVRASGAKRYEVAYRDSDKRLRWETVEGGLAEAQARRDEVRGRKRKGETLAPKSSLTFDEYADAWLAGAPNLRPRTREDYSLKLGRAKESKALARLRLTDVRASHLRTLHPCPGKGWLRAYDR